LTSGGRDSAWLVPVVTSGCLLSAEEETIDCAVAVILHCRDKRSLLLSAFTSDVKAARLPSLFRADSALLLPLLLLVLSSLLVSFSRNKI